MGELFGRYLRTKRQELNRQRGGYSIRKLAQRIRIHHSFLSKVERGEAVSLSYRSLVALAREIGEDPDLLLAMNGKLASEVTRAVLRRPQEFQRMIHELRQEGEAWSPKPPLAEETVRVGEERLARAEGWLRQCMEDGRAVFFLVSPEGVFTHLSRSLETVLQIQVAALEGRSFTALIHPEDCAQAHRHLRQALEGRAGAHEYRVLCEGGSAVWARVSLAPRMDAEGRLLEVQGLILDIDAHCRARAALARAVEAGEAAQRAKGEFLANMSHEMRTPLNGLIGMLQLLGKSCGDPEQFEFVRMALESARRLVVLLSDVLDFARLSEGRASLRKASFNPRELLSSLEGLFRPACEVKGLSMTWQADNDVPGSLLGDEARLRQVLTHLTANAVRFTEKGTVRLRAQLLPPSRPGEARIFFSVTDTGPGIPEAALLRIFEPFAQGDGSMTRRHQGLGLGLALCRTLLRLMNGELWAENMPGGGSRFFFSVGFDLPRA